MFTNYSSANINDKPLVQIIQEEYNRCLTLSIFPYLYVPKVSNGIISYIYLSGQDELWFPPYNKSVAHITENSVSGCPSNLKVLYFPSHVDVEPHVFLKCSNLQYIICPASMQAYFSEYPDYIKIIMI